MSIHPRAPNSASHSSQRPIFPFMGPTAPHAGMDWLPGKFLDAGRAWFTWEGLNLYDDDDDHDDDDDYYDCC